MAFLAGKLAKVIGRSPRSAVASVGVDGSALLAPREAAALARQALTGARFDVSVPPAQTHAAGY